MSSVRSLLRGFGNAPSEADALGEALLDLPRQRLRPRQQATTSTRRLSILSLAWGGIHRGDEQFLNLCSAEPCMQCILQSYSTRCGRRPTIYSCMPPSTSCLSQRSRQVNHVLPCFSLLQNSTERTGHGISVPPSTSSFFTASLVRCCAGSYSYQVTWSQHGVEETTECEGWAAPQPPSAATSGTPPPPRGSRDEEAEQRELLARNPRLALPPHIDSGRGHGSRLQPSKAIEFWLELQAPQDFFSGCRGATVVAIAWLLLAVLRGCYNLLLTCFLRKACDTLAPSSGYHRIP